MRIQHNVMAMNAYRNYTNNTKALSRNLERLSSGYKINRAGDDAAGLAISEKMRAQITGLEAAQKNVKDGISLVNTAEGAMQEVQDMLNRMVYLAQESANGTYDNEVDRMNLQKEMDQLNAEIDRIADSANFNGIKLLDGSLDNGAKAAVEAKTSELDIAATGNELGVNTILHNEAGNATTGTEFSIDLHEVSFNAANGEKLKITLGEGDNKTEIVLERLTDNTTAQKGGAIASAIAGGTVTDWKVTVDGTEVTADAGTLTVSIADQDFTVSANDGRLSFVQAAAPTGDTDTVNGSMKVKIEGVATGAVTAAEIKTDVTTKTATVVAGKDDSGAGDGATGKYTYNFAGVEIKTAGKLKVSIAGQEFEMDVTTATTAAEIAAEARTQLANKIKDGFQDATPADTFYQVTGTGTEVILTATKEGAGNTAIAGDIAVEGGTAAAAGENPVSGDYNVQTTDVKTVGANDKARLASTVVTLKDSMVAKDNAVIIGGQEYTFSTADADKTNANNKVYIGDMVDKDGNIDSAKFDMAKVYERLSDSAASNGVWTVSAKADRKGLTLVEKTDANGASTGNTAAKALDALKAKKLDLTTEEGIKATLGLKTAAKEAVEADDTKGLTLQIGDTSDAFNQLKVSIGDIHAAALGTASLSIADQASAAAAVDKIKDAINTVSSIRGTLGATSNRLDHTANNLSVMRENITDAESAIRDTDIAEEMMAYTKNNILVQSAQAMLAQANQVPQGVLQLLQ